MLRIETRAPIVRGKLRCGLPAEKMRTLSIFVDLLLANSSATPVDMVRQSLEAKSEEWFIWLLCSSAVVVVGCGLEIGETWTDLKRWNRLRKGLPAEEENPRSWLVPIGALGLFLVIAGVAGELVFEGLASHVETALRAHDAQMLAQAVKDAGNAKDSANTAEYASERAQASADAAVLNAGSAQREADAIDGKAKNLDRQLASTKKQLDAVEAKRAELEKSLINMAVCNAPRVIPSWGMGEKTSLDPLLPMAGQKVFIEFVPDREARRAALNLAVTLSDAKWDVQKPLRVVDELEDGVSVQPSQTWMEPTPTRDQLGYFEALDVADKLVDFLQSYNWQAMRGWPLDAQRKMIADSSILPAGSIRIQIGLYPAVTYVSPPGTKDIDEAMARLHQGQQEEAKKMEDEGTKREEEFLKRLSPQQASQIRDSIRASMERSRAERRSSMERISGPCQPLSNLTPRIDP